MVAQNNPSAASTSTVGTSHRLVRSSSLRQEARTPLHGITPAATTDIQPAAPARRNRIAGGRCADRVGALCDAAAMSRITAAALAALLCGGCATAAAQVPLGPGPTNYTVQAQPPPGTCHYRTAADGQLLPDPACTPGAVSPKVTPDTLDDTICRPGYTKSIRPSKAITEAEKEANAAAYSYTGPLSAAEFDHLVPLSLGGDPNDPRNMWTEPGESPNPKDSVEVRLAQLVCDRRVPLAAAQEAIATDWTTALSVVG